MGASIKRRMMQLKGESRQESLSHSFVRLAIIIPVYGNWNDTLDCLGALASQTVGTFRVFLGDDGSPQAPPESVHRFDFITYFRRPHQGFASICNAAVEIAAQSGYTHALLLNNDTSFGASFVEEWLAKATSMPQAIMAPLIYYHDHPNLLWYSGGRKSILVPFSRFSRNFTKQTAVDILTGCVLLVPIDIWMSLRGFNEQYVTYYEDFDFMLRARDLGVPAYVVVEPELRVLHKVSRTTLRQGRWHREYRMLTSRILFIRQRFLGLQKVLCLSMLLPHIAIIALLHLPKLPNIRLLREAIRSGLRSI